MNIITAQTPLSVIALHDDAGATVLGRHRLDFCCGGRRTLGEACVTAGLDVDLVLAELEAEASARSAAWETAIPVDWNTKPLESVIAHVIDKHHAFTREAMGRIDPLIAKVVAKHGERHPELAVVGRTYAALAAELAPHMLREERVLFPYIRSLTGVRPLAPPPFATVANPVEVMMREHEAAGAHLDQLLSVTNGFVAPADACTSYRALYAALAELRRDLLLHVSLENNVLFPRAVALEGERHRVATATPASLTAGAPAPAPFTAT